MSFDRQPTLRGELLELRPLRVEDFDALYSVAADPLIWEQHPDNDRYQKDVFTAFFREALDSGGALVAIDRADGQIIGSSRFHGYDPEASEIEIGWTFLARSHWGGRYNGEMKRLMLRHAFQFVENVIFMVGPRNLRSQRAVEKIGGVRAGTRTDANGEVRCGLRITASEFAGLQAGVAGYNSSMISIRDLAPDALRFENLSTAEVAALLDATAGIIPREGPGMPVPAEDPNSPVRSAGRVMWGPSFVWFHR